MSLQPTSVLPVAREKSQRLSAADVPEADFGTIHELLAENHRCDPVSALRTTSGLPVKRVFELQFHTDQKADDRNYKCGWQLECPSESPPTR